MLKKIHILKVVREGTYKAQAVGFSLGTNW